MRVINSMVCAAVCAAVLSMTSAVWAQAEPDAGAATSGTKEIPQRFQHVRLPGDLDHSDLVKQVGAALEGARAAGLGVVLDVGGNKSRTDVLSALCVTLRDSPVYTVVFLVDNADKRVGAGQLVLALFADKCAIDTDTKVDGYASDIAFRELASDEPDWNVIETELKARLAVELEDVAVSRTVAEKIASGLISPESDFAIAKSAEGCRVVSPQAKGALPLVSEKLITPVPGTIPPPPAFLDATGRELAPLGVATAGSVKNTLAKIGGAMATQKAVNIEDTVERLTVKLEALFADAETLERDVDERLDLPDPAERSVAKGQYHAAAEEGRHNLLEVNRMIGEIEGVVQRVPEILRTPAPGQAVAGAKVTSFAAKWRARIQKLRTRHDALLVKVETFEKVQ